MVVYLRVVKDVRGRDVRVVVVVRTSEARVVADVCREVVLPDCPELLFGEVISMLEAVVLKVFPAEPLSERVAVTLLLPL